MSRMATREDLAILRLLLDSASRSFPFVSIVVDDDIVELALDLIERARERVSEPEMQYATGAGYEFRTWYGYRGESFLAIHTRPRRCEL
jgi:hypothetical protein